MGSAPASLADNPFLITLLLEMQTTIFLRTEMSRKTEYVHNPCFLSANILKILGVFAENQIVYPTENMLTWINNTTKQLADETRAKLYVAVTRAEITIGIIVPDDFCLPSESILQFWSNPD